MRNAVMLGRQYSSHSFESAISLLCSSALPKQIANKNSIFAKFHFKCCVIIESRFEDFLFDRSLNIHKINVSKIISKLFLGEKKVPMNYRNYLIYVAVVP